jgi:hypothetical protein
MSESTKVIFLNFGKIEEKYCLQYLNQVRKHGINAATSSQESMHST